MRGLEPRCPRANSPIANTRAHSPHRGAMAAWCGRVLSKEGEPAATLADEGAMSTLARPNLPTKSEPQCGEGRRPKSRVQNVQPRTVVDSAR